MIFQPLIKILIFSVSLPVILGETAIPRFTPTDLVTMARPGSFYPSKDGSQVIYSTSTYDKATNKKTTRYHLLDVKSKETKDITSITTTDFDLVQFDKNEVEFISSRNGKPNLFKLALDKENSLKQLTNFTYDELNNARIHNNKLIFTTAVPIKDLKKTYSSALIYDQLYVRHWDTWFDYKNQHIHVADLSNDKLSSEATNLFKDHKYFESPIRPFYDSDNFEVSSDGKHILFVTRPNKKDVAWKTTLDLYLVNTEGKPNFIKLNKEGLGAISSPKFSPDGKTLGWVQMESDINESDKGLITLYDIKTKAYKVVNHKWDAAPSSFDFSKDGKSIYLSLADDGYNKLYEFNLSTLQPKALTNKGSASLVHENEKELLVSIASTKSPNELYTLSKQNGQLNLISSINSKFLSNFDFNGYEPFYFIGAKNERVQGFLIKPPHFDAKKKYPVMFWVHGGPESSFNDNWSNRWNYQIPAQAGYVVVAINFHGSPGWGMQFTKSILKNWGSYPFEDLMKGLDHALNKYSFLDCNRMVAWGASYGGYMINWINGHTNRFKALVTHDGKFDSKHSYYTTEELYFMESEYGGTPYDNKAKETFEKYSPSNYVTQWKTPTQVIHGAKDYRLVDGEGLAVFTALQRQGIPSKLVYFPDENHWVLKNANSLVWMHENLKWSAHWLNYTNPYSLDL